MVAPKITLKAALKAGKLEAFVADQEAQGIRTGDMAEFDNGGKPELCCHHPGVVAGQIRSTA